MDDSSCASSAPLPAPLGHLPEDGFELQNASGIMHPASHDSTSHEDALRDPEQVEDAIGWRTPDCSQRQALESRQLQPPTLQHFSFKG